MTAQPYPINNLQYHKSFKEERRLLCDKTIYLTLPNPFKSFFQSITHANLIAFEWYKSFDFHWAYCFFWESTHANESSHGIQIVYLIDTFCKCFGKVYFHSIGFAQYSFTMWRLFFTRLSSKADLVPTCQNTSNQVAISYEKCTIHTMNHLTALTKLLNKRSS